MSFGCVYGRCNGDVIADREDGIDNFLECFPLEYTPGEYCDCCDCCNPDTKNKEPCVTCSCRCASEDEYTSDEEKDNDEKSIEDNESSEDYYSAEDNIEDNVKYKGEDNTEEFSKSWPFVVKYIKKDFLPKYWGNPEIGALSPREIRNVDDSHLKYNDIGTLCHISGWIITGYLREDYYEYVDKFHARHPHFGCVYGSFNKKVIASSNEAFEHFTDNHNPQIYDPNDE
jgi:hypothetical protein